MINIKNTLCNIKNAKIYAKKIHDEQKHQNVKDKIQQGWIKVK